MTSSFELRSGTVDLLYFTIKQNNLSALEQDLKLHKNAAPAFFSDEGLAIDIRLLARSKNSEKEENDTQNTSLIDIVQLLKQFHIQVVAVIAYPEQEEWVKQCGLPLLDAPNKHKWVELPKTSHQTKMAAENKSAQNETLIIEKTLRSGQQVYSQGDVIVMGPVNEGAEVMAEGNIHIYGPLRGRAHAGIKGNTAAKIFNTACEPELIAIAGIYRTAENPLPQNIIGQPVKIFLNEGNLLVESLSLK